MVAWAVVQRAAVQIQGETREYASSDDGRRHFCSKCGTSLFYINERAFPGMIAVQVATLDNPDAIPPAAQIQVAERIRWMDHFEELPQFDRFPG